MELIMNLEKMLDVLENNIYEPDYEDYCLVMHDLYTTYAGDQVKGEEGFENLINVMKFNFQINYKYKTNKEISSLIKNKLGNASKHVDNIISSGNLVETYFTNAMRKIENGNKK